MLMYYNKDMANVHVASSSGPRRHHTGVQSQCPASRSLRRSDARNSRRERLRAGSCRFVSTLLTLSGSKQPRGPASKPSLNGFAALSQSRWRRKPEWNFKLGHYRTGAGPRAETCGSSWWTASMHSATWNARTSAPANGIAFRVPASAPRGRTILSRGWRPPRN